MRAMVLTQLKSPLVLEERTDPVAGPGEAVVRLNAAALNRRDFWITLGMYPGIQLPVVPGSDGAGTVVRIGDGVSSDWQNRDVVINPGWGWGDDPAAQAAEFQILGMPVNGTFATHVKVPVEYLAPRPSHLSWHESAALPLAGVTAYRAVVTQGRVSSGDNVLVTGIGGGVATWALQIARACGANVVVTSSSDEKLARAKDLGAIAGYDYRAEGWSKQLVKDHGPMQLVIDSAGGEGYGKLLDIAAPGGRIVNYGATAGPPPKLDLFKVFWKQLHLIGSTMGSPADFAALLSLVNEHQLRPVIDRVFPLEQANEALNCLRDSSQFGNVVLETGSESAA